MPKLFKRLTFLIPYSLFLIPFTARAQFGLKETCIAAGLCKAGKEAPGPAALAGTIVGYLLAFVGVIFFGLMLYGGFLWMTSRGNTEQVKKAQDTITTSIIGIIIIFLSYVVTRFVVARITGAAGI